MKPALFTLGVVRTPSDLLWNFEKFLADANGVPRYRFSPKFPTKDLAPYIEELIKEAEAEGVAGVEVTTDQAAMKDAMGKA